MKKSALFNSYIPIISLLMIVTGCKLFTPEELIFGTAQINDKNYKDSKMWYWNYHPEAPPLVVRPHFKSFDFHTQLKPETTGLPNYSISFYVDLDIDSIKIGYPYKLGHYKNYNITSYEYWNVVPYFYKNRSNILSTDHNGIAFALVENSEIPISLSGELVIEQIYNKTSICTGYYSLTTSDDAVERLVIKGKFEANLYSSFSISI